ncbi:MAG: inorganic phosphate transporter [Candidatus Calescibacterium sp.]|nr:inorganic phosphate transporter [Candidatus Calescibacterium sp.]MCX7971865.1 inorganic phosphate transporter [bacterium]MDW8195036.1 inorganic phosphate transporter [Candidatus Calescibacterium sp.]
MEGIFIVLIIVILLAWLFDYTNGLNDAANAIATVVSTRVLRPLSAVALAALFNFLGAFISIEVATTVGKGIVDPKAIDIYTIFAGLVGAISWNLFATYLGMPISASHSLIGGIVGASISHASFNIVNLKGLISKVMIPSIISPLVGILAAILFFIISYSIASFLRAHMVNRIFSFLQLVSASYMALSHGANDAQKTMGVIAMALVTSGVLSSFEVPFWVKFSAAFFISLGTLMGGWKVIKTLGMRLTKLRPIDGFSAETAAATTIITASFLGMPISTTYVITSSVMGVGMSKKINAVKWSLFSTIIIAWLFTIPGSALVAFLTYKVLSLLFK